LIFDNRLPVLVKFLRLKQPPKMLFFERIALDLDFEGRRSATLSGVPDHELLRAVGSNCLNQRRQ
jgi:hypothetical protein